MLPAQLWVNETRLEKSPKISENQKMHKDANFIPENTKKKKRNSLQVIEKQISPE